MSLPQTSMTTPELQTLQAVLTPLTGIARVDDWQAVDQRGEPGASATVTFAEGTQVRLSLNADTIFLDAPVGSGTKTVSELLAVLKANTAAPFKFRLEPLDSVPVFALEGRFAREERFDLAVLVWQAWLAVQLQRHLIDDLWRNA